LTGKQNWKKEGVSALGKTLQESEEIHSVIHLELIKEVLIYFLEPDVLEKPGLKIVKKIVLLFSAFLHLVISITIKLNCNI
jgi:hypothetical protein